MSSYRKITWPFKRIYRWVKKSIQYSLFLWDDYDHNSLYLLRLIGFKLKRMQYQIMVGDRLEKDSAIYEINKVISLIDYIFEEDYAKEERKAHDKKFGEMIWTFSDYVPEKGGYLLNITREKVDNEAKKVLERKEHKKIIQLEIERKEKAYKDLFMLILNHIDNWSN